MSARQPDPPHQGIVLFCHGARRPSWREPFDALRNELAARVPGVAVRLAFLELMQPELPAVFEELHALGAHRLLVVPVFLAPGAHTRRICRA
ncbi:MAG: CbiX/SirB N-terminal domain-containing protein [Burkholderiaceae bacterium]